jgi:anthranilate synthase component II
MKLLIIDNYDSFTYNLVHQVRELGCNFKVVRNDKISLHEITRFDKIILSPGPGIPEEAGILKALISRFAATKSILGVCLGHQAIAEVCGAKLTLLDRVYHGLASNIQIVGDDDLFKRCDRNMTVGRYHSWIINRSTLPPELEITAVDHDGEIMAIRHKKYDVCGVQFHPESILTPNGIRIIQNFVDPDQTRACTGKEIE